MTINHKIIALSIIFVIFASLIGAKSPPTQDYNNALTRSIADTVYCKQFGNCILSNLSVFGDFVSINVTQVTINVTDSIIINGTDINDIFIRINPPRPLPFIGTLEGGNISIFGFMDIGDSRIQENTDTGDLDLSSDSGVITIGNIRISSGIITDESGKITTSATFELTDEETVTLILNDIGQSEYSFVAEEDYMDLRNGITTFLRFTPLSNVFDYQSNDIQTLANVFAGSVLTNNYQAEDASGMFTWSGSETNVDANLDFQDSSTLVNVPSISGTNVNLSLGIGNFTTKGDAVYGDTPLEADTVVYFGKRVKFAPLEGGANRYIEMAGSSASASIQARRFDNDQTRELTLQPDGNRIYMFGVDTSNTEFDIMLHGSSGRSIGIVRHPTSHGQDLSLHGSGAGIGSSNKIGGEVILKSGISTGNRVGGVQIWTTTAGSSGTSDNNPTFKWHFQGDGSLVAQGAYAISTAGSGTLSSILYPTSDGSANDIIKTDGAGTLSFVTPTSHTQISFSMYDAEPARGSETSLDGAFIKIADAQPLNSVPTDLVVSKGTGKMVIVINAGSDLVGDITVTGTSVDRNTGATTGSDTDIITVDSLTTDNSDTDTNGNTRHAFVGAYITSKWFTGTVTLSTADLTLTDVDIYHISFEQFDDTANIILDTFDANILTTNVNAEFDAYLYSIMVTGDKATIAREASLNVGADGETALANRYWRLRRGNIDKSLDGTTDGTWIDVHYANSPAYVEDVSIKVWATEIVPLTFT